MSADLTGRVQWKSGIVTGNDTALRMATRTESLRARD